MEARRQVGYPAAHLAGSVVLKELSFSKAFARACPLGETAQHPGRDSSPVRKRETHLSGPRCKIAPARLGMSDCGRESGEQVWRSSRVRRVMLVKHHDFLITRPGGSCEHVVATRALLLFDLRASGHHSELYVRRKAQCSLANRFARRFPKQLSLVARSPPGQQGAQKQHEAQETKRWTPGCLCTVLDLIRHRWRFHGCRFHGRRLGMFFRYLTFHL
jgi:hypothetical protein